MISKKSNVSELDMTVSAKNVAYSAFLVSQYYAPYWPDKMIDLAELTAICCEFHTTMQSTILWTLDMKRAGYRMVVLVRISYYLLLDSIGTWNSVYALE